MNGTRRQIRATLLLVAGLLMGFAAVVNAGVAIPHLREDMAEIHVRPTLLGAVSLGLSFGAFAMFAFALVVLGAAFQAWRGAAPARLLLWVVAANYAIFGVVAFAWSRSGHSLGYAVMGALIGLAAALPVRPAA